MSDVLLALNVDHIATIRNLRGTKYPDPVHAAFIAEKSGKIDGITVHLREDRRHITDRDIKLLRETIQTTMNLEIAVVDEMINIAYQIKPDFCCLVPEKRQELTTEGGLNLINQVNRLKDVVSKLQDVGIRVSLFIDPDEKQIDAACLIGAACVELHTGLYANALNNNNIRIIDTEYKRIANSIKYADNCGLIVNAGHGLNYSNVQAISKFIEIQELNIGHSIISRAIFDGLLQAILDMKTLLIESRRIRSDSWNRNGYNRNR
ncbi:Pyridoxine 5'-phosphate synthase [Candidatus Blochmanniella vafra str. BVAF]|uniref:Pyridoxine 5'-phosphate synthase n=1 Tax=Blochmanniella vafra (strain BVAF) TaxID=859654 RepID=E8Q6F4_BLOVB|nr:pyridoxine 5'-phosphate synthase [Candidatus Blochmannia vafer]ADV33923.1 Pyridoxine 5'-phosphate synthase [Candidatus Blochmannia vafer str. BVAF]